MRAVPYRILIALSAVSLLWSPVARAADDDDLVMLVNGGRLRGVVIEEDPQKGVRIKLVDGQIRSLKPSEVREVQYHGASAPAPAAAPAVAPAVAPPPATFAAVPTVPAPVAAVAAPPPPPPPYQPSYAAPPPYPAPTQAPAATPDHRPGKFELGMRLGIALPMGHLDGTGTTTDSFGVTTVYDSPAMSSIVSLKIPILIEAGYEVAPGLVLGLYAQYGVLREKAGARAGCAPGLSCSDHDIELGLQGQYHFSRGGPVDPWLGLGFGYESWSRSGSGDGISYSVTTHGPQFLKLQGGADFQVASALTVGPFLSLSFAQYTSYSYSTGGESGSKDIAFTALHEWLAIGAKGSFRIGP